MRKTKIRWSMLLLGFLLIGAGIAQASPIAITNPSFEDPVITPPAYHSVGSHGWGAGSEDNYIYLASSHGHFPQGAQDGANVLCMKGVSSSRGQAFATVEAGKTYTVSAYVGLRTGYANAGYRVSLCDTDAGWTHFAGVTDVSAWQTGGIGSGPSAVAGAWTQVSFSVLIPSEKDGHGVALYLSTPSTGGASSWIAFDNVTADVIPEPATLGLLVIGGGFALWRKRR